MITLPKPNYPMLTRMVSDPLFPKEGGGSSEPITWALSSAHPLVPDMKITRMFVDRNGVVEIYSHDGKTGMRNVIPQNHVRITEEVMPMEIFAGEIAAAESPPNDEDDEEDEDEDDEDDEAAPTGAPAAAPATSGEPSS